MVMIPNIHFDVVPSGLNIFEVRNEIMAYTVNLSKMRCSYRQWDLNGIERAHFMATLYSQWGPFNLY